MVGKGKKGEDGGKMKTNRMKGETFSGGEINRVHVRTPAQKV